MFALPIVELSHKMREGPSQWLAEFVATFGIIAETDRRRTPRAGSNAVACRALHLGGLLVHRVNLVRQPRGHRGARADRLVFRHCAGGGTGLHCCADCRRSRRVFRRTASSASRAQGVISGSHRAARRANRAKRREEHPPLSRDSAGGRRKAGSGAEDRCHAADAMRRPLVRVRSPLCSHFADSLRAAPKIFPFTMRVSCVSLRVGLFDIVNR